ncbi:MAG: hypothetical protein ABI175_20595 [Polyangiales bacterium]
MTGITVARILKELERYYEASAEDVAPYLRAHVGDEAREALLVREDDEYVDVALCLPPHVTDSPWRTLTLDERCQVIEGASHFLVVCERARSERSTTHLELELQAEVDKWLVLSQGGTLDPDRDVWLRGTLYEAGEFLHVDGSAEGERYRLANALAARFVHRLSHTYARKGRHAEMQRELVRFFRMTQEEKLRAIAA